MLQSYNAKDSSTLPPTKNYLAYTSIVARLRSSAQKQLHSCPETSLRSQPEFSWLCRFGPVVGITVQSVWYSNLLSLRQPGNREEVTRVVPPSSGAHHGDLTSSPWALPPLNRTTGWKTDLQHLEDIYPNHGNYLTLDKAQILNSQVDNGGKHLESCMLHFSPVSALVCSQTGRLCLETVICKTEKQRFFSIVLQNYSAIQGNLLHMLNQLAFIVRMTFKEDERQRRFSRIMRHCLYDVLPCLTAPKLVWYLIPHLSICLFICAFIHPAYFWDCYIYQFPGRTFFLFWKNFSYKIGIILQLV